MGDVYHARDPKLGREVAIKILPTSFAADPERLARFEREARVLASLNHPHIAQIYGLESPRGAAPAIVMELVAGETLADRIQRGPLKIGEALAIARQIAGALDAAHEKGIVHRDLKPSNIALTNDAVVKILDFGLAKDVSQPELSDLTQSPTMLGATATGVLLGTVPYMSPEQARGKAVDKRTDIWAFGCVLYEMLAGVRAFPGETTTDTLAAILEREPDWTKLPPAVDSEIRRLVARCLAKDPAKRQRDIGDVHLEVVDGAGATKPGTDRRARGRWTAVAAALAIVAAIAGGYARYAGIDPAVAHFTFRPIAADAAEERSPAWSPDGRNIAFTADVSGVPQVLVTSNASFAPQPITDTPAGCINPFWSPDGKRIFFTSAGGLWSVGAAGGSPVAVAKNASLATVAPDGSLAIVRGLGGDQQLWIQAAGAKEPVQYSTKPFPATFVRASGLEFSRTGSRIAILIELQEDGRFKHQLWLLPFPSGEPQLMPDHDRLGPGRDFPTRRLSWEPDDRHLVVANEEAGRGMHLFRADIKTGSLEPITTGTDSENAPAVSPDGSQIAYMSGAVDFDLIEASPNDGRTRVLLGTPRSELFPVWLTDSRYAYITAMRGTPEIWARDGAGWPVPILTAGNDQSNWLALERLAVSKDRRRIAYGAVFRDRHAIWIVPIAGGQPVPLDDPSIDQHGAAWSPDGNSIAYQRLSGTHWNLVTRPVGPGSPEVLADAAPGGGSTAWSPLGDWIAFARADGLQGVSPNGKKQMLFSPQRVSAFDFTADGRHIYAARRGPDRAWEIATIDVATQTETVTRLDVPTNASVVSLNADATGRRLVLAVGTPKFDVWLLEGYGTARK